MNIEKEIPYVKISYNPVMDFFKKFFIGDFKANNLIIISPIITGLVNTRFSIERLKNRIENDKIFTYIITREPKEDYHKQAIDILKNSDFVEIRYNNSLHAKLYICALDEPIFAILGSGNLTRTSIEKNIEIGMLIFPQDKGKQILHELYYWG
ncbi:hypothetical protein DRQ09_04775, partial [candidate division KSB1 bacterium]